jgi:hemerythrin-like domain-containing protein
MYKPFISQLLYEHIRTRRVLRVIEKQLELASRCEEANLGLLKRAVDHQRGLPARLHHAHEDRLFDCLTMAAPELCQELGILRLQHQEMLQLEDWLLDMVQDAMRYGQAAYPRLMYFGNQYLRMQKSHSGIEEKTVFPRASSVLSAADWALLDRPRLDDAGGPADARMQREVIAIYRRIMDEAQLAA